MIALTIEVLHHGKVARSGSAAKPRNPLGTELFCGKMGSSILWMLCTVGSGM